MLGDVITAASISIHPEAGVQLKPGPTGDRNVGIKCCTQYIYLPLRKSLLRQKKVLSPPQQFQVFRQRKLHKINYFRYRNMGNLLKELQGKLNISTNAHLKLSS